MISRSRFSTAQRSQVAQNTVTKCIAASQLDDRQLLDKIGWERFTRLDYFDHSLRNGGTDAKAVVIQRCFLEFSCWDQGAVPDGPGKRGSSTRLDSRNDSKEASTFGYAKCDVIRAICHVGCGCHHVNYRVSYIPCTESRMQDPRLPTDEGGTTRGGRGTERASTTDGSRLSQNSPYRTAPSGAVTNVPFWPDTTVLTTD